MAYSGYLVKIEGVILPNRFIQSYKCTPEQQQDKDSYQDITGQLHREILPHKRSKVEFTTPPLWLDKLEEFHSYFPDRNAQPKITVEYWNHTRRAYYSGEFYVPDITYEIILIRNNNILHSPIRIALIEY